MNEPLGTRINANNTSAMVEKTGDLPIGTIELSLAVVADMHCQLKTETKIGQESFLIIGEPRVPPLRHPVQALIDLSNRDNLRTDVLLCPGDITNRASPEGLSQGFSYLQELGQTLHSSVIACTIGNHDVDWRKCTSNNSFTLARTIHPAFPLPPAASQQYWADGYSIVEVDSRALVIVINTVVDHVNETTAKRGTFPEHSLGSLASRLATYSSSGRFPLRIALLHHHPILHSNIDYNSDDVLQNGDRIIEILAQNRVDIVIHGHKHQPRLRRQSLHGHDIMIFAAGSFSAMLRDFGSTTRNLFHIMHLSKSIGQPNFSAILTNWEYNHGNGWNAATRRSSGLPYIINFSGRPDYIDAMAVARHILTQTPPLLHARDLYVEYPKIEYLLPDELHALGVELERQHGIKFTYDEYGMLYEVGLTIRS